MLTCSACGTENRPGRRFCGQCGGALAVTCGECGAENEPGDRFCGNCGSPLSAPATVSATPTSPAPGASERRLVSVLFADLVGFTTLSERRDPEEVRDLLGRYFERCRTLIERYGGTVEKFIGDAVMAVWGTPVAREDDAERAVRAALSMTQAVTLLGQEIGMPGLRVRAGVLTGNASVEAGLGGEATVMGDTVNTASRLQSIAAPGTVLVDDVTRRASEAAIAYEDAGAHEVKGREQPVHAWTALRVVAGSGGARRSAGLEAPLMGRERELSRVIEAFESGVEQRRAARVTVVGQAGSGKSRLLWELLKYIDGVEKIVRWHEGRCLSYGEGVSYWALAEMVRSRAGITDEESPTSAREKLRAAVQTYVADERERGLVEPRLAHLLGLEQRTATDRADLFSGWRLFFERMAENQPVALVFEDLQWADSGLLDFIDYLLEWSAGHPIFILALGRPELLDVRPGWAASSIALGSLPDAAMRELLEGLVPGLPDEVARRVLDRAEGVPLYAVEIVRMLLDRGLLEQHGSRYRLTGEIGELDIPETLQALAAARLDGLNSTERTILQDASVFGRSFTPAGVAMVSQRPAESVTAALDGLVTKQVLGRNNDPLSPERGQYHFLQALLRTIAYGTLSRRDRKALHLAAARHLQESWGESAPELAEVLASHFVDAAAADPDAADAARIRAAASETLAEAGQRALSLALGAEAMRAFDRAAELAGDEATRGRLLDQAGQAAYLNGSYELATDRLQSAISVFEAVDDQFAIARSLITQARIHFAQDRLQDAVPILRRAVDGLPDDSAEQADALSELARALAFAGALDEAFEAANAALVIAEPLEHWTAIVHAFNAISLLRRRAGRVTESTALLEQALRLALEHDLPQDALRAYNNRADASLQREQFADAIELTAPGLAMAEARGDRFWQGALSLMTVASLIGLGRWDEALERLSTVRWTAGVFELAVLPMVMRISVARGDEAETQRWMSLIEEQPEQSSNEEYAAGPIVALAIGLNGRGAHGQALATALPVAMSDHAVANEDRRDAYQEAGVAALALGDEETIERLIAHVDAMAPALRSPLMRASAARLRAQLARRRGQTDAALSAAADALSELNRIEMPFVRAQLLVEQAEILLDSERGDDATPALAEAIEIFTRLRAQPWLQRAQAVAAATPGAPSPGSDSPASPAGRAW